MIFKQNTKKKGIVLKAEEQSQFENKSDKEFAKVVRNFKKFFRRDSKDYKRMSSRRSNQILRKKEINSDEPIFYECKGYGHYAKECANKKKLKTHKKAIAATWDDDSDESESELIK